MESLSKLAAVSLCDSLERLSSREIHDMICHLTTDALIILERVAYRRFLNGEIFDIYKMDFSLHVQELIH